VVEDGDAVGGQPHVALEPGGAETKCQLKGGDRVLPCVCARTPMGERDGAIEE
jgi:hypothetical protein